MCNVCSDNRRDLASQSLPCHAHFSLTPAASCVHDSSVNKPESHSANMMGTFFILKERGEKLITGGEWSR